MAPEGFYTCGVCGQAHFDSRDRCVFSEISDALERIADAIEKIHQPEPMKGE